MALTELRCEQSVWPVVMLPIPKGGKVAKVICQAGEEFALETGLDPEFAFVRVIPPGAEELVEVRGMTLIKFDLLPDGWVAVGRGGMERVDQEFKRWRKT
jgi:hypothetical protein